MGPTAPEVTSSPILATLNGPWAFLLMATCHTAGSAAAIAAAGRRELTGPEPRPVRAAVRLAVDLPAPPVALPAGTGWCGPEWETSQISWSPVPVRTRTTSAQFGQRILAWPDGPMRSLDRR